MVRLLERLGFVVARQRGAHKRLIHPDGRRTTVPDHGGDSPRGRSGPPWRMWGGQCAGVRWSRGKALTAGAKRRLGRPRGIGRCTVRVETSASDCVRT
ncbi:MAG: type II toxin-antitoxin system HicA family toxin [Acidobacteriota bacterium]|nr:type II toxin-antitoxin system HicA family toxin [Acidobacteriota bacterium]